MIKKKIIRLGYVASKLNVGTSTIVKYLLNRGFEIENRPNFKITSGQFDILSKEFGQFAVNKNNLDFEKKINISNSKTNNAKLNILNFKKNKKLKIENSINIIEESDSEELKNKDLKERIKLKKDFIKSNNIFNKKKIVLSKPKITKGLTVLGKIDLSNKKKKKIKQIVFFNKNQEKNKKFRKRIENKVDIKNLKSDFFKYNKNKKVIKDNISEKEIQEQIKNTLAKINSKKKNINKINKYRKEKKSSVNIEDKLLKEKKEAKLLKVIEFISVKDLSLLMNVSVNQVLSICMSIGISTSINQRLDKETITLIADEFNYKVEFSTLKEEEYIKDNDDPKNLLPRAPIVTVMGHVDHGKTSLINYIRNIKTFDIEAGGITQHIGAYDVIVRNGKKIIFLDTPGHEAFAAMRSRSVKITDIVVVVISADDNIQSQTKEVINHAVLAGVSVVIAINKIDKPEANPEKIKEQLAGMNILVEDWGGKYQSQEISTKTGVGIDLLLEKILFEAELLELKANPNKKAKGTILESSLNKGRGYEVTAIVQSGTLKIGDIILAGMHYGKIKTMFDYKKRKINNAKPITIVQILGLNGAPRAGDLFKVMNYKEVKDIAYKKERLIREQNLKTKTYVNLNKIKNQLSISNFKEINIIVKGDVDGSIEALVDTLLALSMDSIKINIIHKGIGNIIESDILLASTFNAIIIGFRIKPCVKIKKIAEIESVEIKLYSIIYNVINDVKSAVSGMLKPSTEEYILGNALIREIFKISNVGTIAGSYITNGFISKLNSIRLIRNKSIIHTGLIKQLKRFKSEVKELKSGFEGGITIKNFNDIQVNDVIESFEIREKKEGLLKKVK